METVAMGSQSPGSGLRKRTTPVLSNTASPKSNKTSPDIATTTATSPALRLTVPQLSPPIPYSGSPAPAHDILYGIVDKLIATGTQSPLPLPRKSRIDVLMPGRQPSQGGLSVNSVNQLSTPCLLPLPASPMAPIPYKVENVLTASPLPPALPPKENIPVGRPTSEYSGGLSTGTERPSLRPLNIRKVLQPPIPSRTRSSSSSASSRRSSLLSSNSGWPSKADTHSLARTDSSFSDGSTYSQTSSSARDSLFTKYSNAAPSTFASTAGSIDSSLKYTQKFANKGAPAARRRASNLKLSRSIQRVELEQHNSDIPKLWAELDEQAEEEAEAKEAWSISKWLLLMTVSALFSYGLVGLAIALLTWLRTWEGADVVLITNHALLVYLTLASITCLITALLGLMGTILNSRPILAFYNLLLWPTLVAVLVVGYSSYKTEHHALDRKMNQLWSQAFDDLDRLRIQNTLHCCGYYNALHDATFSKRCYPRTNLPGCKSKLLLFEHDFLRQCYRIVFSIVPVHIFVTFVAVLCSNHVNNMFGKGFTPAAYRLTITDVRQSAMDTLRNLPSRPTSQHQTTTRQRSASVASRAESLVSLPGSETGLLGLGLREDCDHRR